MQFYLFASFANDGKRNKLFETNANKLKLDTAKLCNGFLLVPQVVNFDEKRIQKAFSPSNINDGFQFFISEKLFYLKQLTNGVKTCLKLSPFTEKFN